MFDKLLKKIKGPTDSESVQAAPAASSPKSASEEAEDMLDETGTFMLDLNKLKECEDLDDLLNEV